MIALAQESGGPCHYCRRPIIRLAGSLQWLHTDGLTACLDSWRLAETGEFAAPAPPVVPLVPVYARRKPHWRWAP